MLTSRPPREDGHPAKATSADLRDKPRRVRLCVDIDRPLLGKLKALAFSESKSVTDLVAELIAKRFVEEKSLERLP